MWSNLSKDRNGSIPGTESETSQLPRHSSASMQAGSTTQVMSSRDRVFSNAEAGRAIHSVPCLRSVTPPQTRGPNDMTRMRKAATGQNWYSDEDWANSFPKMNEKTKPNKRKRIGIRPMISAVRP